MSPVDIAKQLGKALAESSEYQNYKKFKGILDQHESAKVMMEDFRKKQWELERKKISGDKSIQASEDELRKLSEVVGLNPYIRDYLMSEFQFSQLMMEVQKIIGEAVGLEMPEEMLANGKN